MSIKDIDRSKLDELEAKYEAALQEMNAAKQEYQAKVEEENKRRSIVLRDLAKEILEKVIASDFDLTEYSSKNEKDFLWDGNLKEEALPEMWEDPRVFIGSVQENPGSGSHACPREFGQWSYDYTDKDNVVISVYAPKEFVQSLLDEYEEDL